MFKELYTELSKGKSDNETTLAEDTVRQLAKTISCLLSRYGTKTVLAATAVAIDEEMVNEDRDELTDELVSLALNYDADDFYRSEPERKKIGSVYITNP